MNRCVGALVAVACATAALAGCSSGSNGDGDALDVVSSTGYLTDAIHNIAPGIEVTTLVAPGGDPHTQELTTADIQKVDSADLVVWTSHDMEHRMMEHFDSLGDKSLPAAEAIPEKDLLPWETDDGTQGHDPHVWNSPLLWNYVVDSIADKLSDIDPDNASTYADNAKKYKSEIQDAHEEAMKKLAQIPENKRILITGHDAFNYLGATYKIDVHATDLVTSESQISAAELNDLAELIVQHEVKVIFQDNLKNPEAIQHLKESVRAKGGDVEVADTELFADTLGESAPTDTYLGAFKSNIEVISEALR